MTNTHCSLHPRNKQTCLFSRVARRLPLPPQRQEVLAPPYPSKQVTEDERIRYTRQISFFPLLTNTHFPSSSKTSECACFQGWHVVCCCCHHHLPPPTTCHHHPPVPPPSMSAYARFQGRVVRHCHHQPPPFTSTSTRF